MSTSNKYKLALDITADTLHAQKSITALSNSIAKANLRTGMIGGSLATGLSRGMFLNHFGTRKAKFLYFLGAET